MHILECDRVTFLVPSLRNATGFEVYSSGVLYSGKFSRAQISSKSPENTPGKKFRDYYFRDKVTISYHTPYNFPHVNGDLQRVFQRQNDGKTLACLSKRVGRCWQRTAMPKEGS